MPSLTILYLRCDSVGDHVLSACMLAPIRRAYPDARLVVVTPDSAASIYQRCPFVNEIFEITFARFGSQDFRQSVARQLQEFKADICLSPAYSRSEVADFLSAATLATQRIGHAGNLSRVRAEHRESNNRRYTKLVPSSGLWKPELDRHADFLAGINVPFNPNEIRPTVWTGPDDEDFATAVFEEHSLDPRQTVALFAGAQHGFHKYQFYGKAIAAACRDRDLQLIALGGDEDSATNLSNLNDAGVRGVNLSGKTTLLQAAAILRRCRLAVGAETALAHIACAVSTPNVVLLGGGHFGRFMPYSALSTVACLPLACYGCDWKCKYDRVHCTWDMDPSVLSAAFSHALDNPGGACPKVFCQSAESWNKTVLSLVDPGTAPPLAWPGAFVQNASVEVYQLDAAGMANRCRLPSK